MTEALDPERKKEFLVELAGAFDKRRSPAFPVPSPQFDPRVATPEQLRHFGFPPKPDRKTNPKVYDFWIKLFSPPLKYVETRSASSILQIDDTLDSFADGSPLPAYSTRHESSVNWSGGYIAPRDGRMFTQLYGSWQVPSGTAPAGADLSNYQSSVWLGFDGQRSYLNSSLPQMGTVQYFDTSGATPVVKAQAWFQWWEPGLTPLPVSLPLQVKPGDLIACALIVTDNEHVKFVIKNQTTGDLVLPFDIQAPQEPFQNGTILKQLTVSGATAEWILERPTQAILVVLPGGAIEIKPGPLRNLPNYGTEVFTDCLAVSALDPAAPGRTETLVGARLIDMYEIDKKPTRTTFISRAQRESDDTIATVFT